MARRLLCVAGASASMCAGAFGQEEKSLQLLANGIGVSPISVARVVWTESGIERVGEWMDCRGSQHQRGPVDEMVFDCYYHTGTCNGTTGLWYFGTGYCNGLATNDMTVADDTVVETGMGRLDFAWYWTCGAFLTEECILAVFTQESVPCTLDSWDYSGWALNFGPLTCNPGGYYYTEADISSVGVWPVPEGREGSYAIGFLTSSGGAMATCAQPMLWGTGDARGDPNAPGTQGPSQLDDDAPLDGTHTTDECYTYSFGVCPDPLGTAAAFWGERAGDLCAQADCNRDGSIDVMDFTCFFNLWVPKDVRADCNGDGTVNTQDVTCFLNQWVACR